MKFLLLGSLVMVLVVVMTGLFWLGKAGLNWLVTGYALVVASQIIPLLSYKEGIENG